MPGLGRIPQVDLRNANFPIRTLVAGLPERSFTWSIATWLDQGQEGECVGFSFAHEVAARPYVFPQTIFDARYWYRRAKALWPGEHYPGDGTSVLAGAKILTEAGHYREYRWAETERDIALAVGYRGPVVIGVDWFEGMFAPDAGGFLNLVGGPVGGHAILVHSISIKGGFYWLHNSWGQSWGINGRAKLRRADMAYLLASNGEACLPVRRRLKP